MPDWDAIREALKQTEQAPAETAPEPQAPATGLDQRLADSGGALSSRVQEIGGGRQLFGRNKPITPQTRGAISSMQQVQQSTDPAFTRAVRGKLQSGTMAALGGVAAVGRAGGTLVGEVEQGALSGFQTWIAQRDPAEVKFGASEKGTVQKIQEYQQKVAAFEEENGRAPGVNERISLYQDVQDLPGVAQGVNEAIFAALTPDPFLKGAKILRGGLTASKAKNALFLERFTPTQQVTLKKLSTELRGAEKIGEQVAELKSKELSSRAGKISAILDGQPDVRRALDAAKAARAGELPKGDFTSIVGKFTDDELDEILKVARDSSEPAYTKVRLMSLFDPSDPASIVNGRLPTRGELALLERNFGPDIAGALASKRGLQDKVWDKLTDAWNAPRTLFASADLSAPGRQGIVLTTAHPRVAGGAFKAQLKAFGSERYAQRLMQTIDEAPLSPIRKNAGLYLADIAGDVTLSAREEAFMSNIAERLPGVGRLVRASERAYATYLNKLRADVFDQTVRNWQDAKKLITNKDLRDLATFINNATGRGSLKIGSKSFDELRPALNAVFFSPGFQLSRVQLAASFLNPTISPMVRREMYKSAAAFIGTGVTALAMLHYGLGAEVELDPRSSDFGKGRIGNTRFDFWGGLLPWARFAAQTWTGERKTSGGEVVNIEDEYGLSKGNTALRFARSKLNPSVGLITDLMAGETFLGDEISTDPSFLGE
jgi:hypothetical protein